MTATSSAISTSSGLLVAENPVTLADEEGSPEKLVVGSKKDDPNDDDVDDDFAQVADAAKPTETAYSGRKKRRGKVDNDSPKSTTVSDDDAEISQDATNPTPLSKTETSPGPNEKPRKLNWQLDDDDDMEKEKDFDNDEYKQTDTAADNECVCDTAFANENDNATTANDKDLSDSDGSDVEFDDSKSTSSKRKMGGSKKGATSARDTDVEETSDDEAELNDMDKPDEFVTTNDANNDVDNDGLQQVEEETFKAKDMDKKETDNGIFTRKAKGKADTQQQPDPEDILVSVDNLFLQADKETVTVKDILKSLEAEYDVPFTKANKKIVRSHLVDLMSGLAKPSVGHDDQEEGQEPSEAGSEPPSDDEEASIASDASSDYEEQTKKNHRRPAAKTKTSSKKKSSDATRTDKKRTSPRESKANKAAASIRAHAEKLRKKRMQELRIRNEEMQVSQRNEEDQKRAEAIAAKFETNTDEMRYQRLEDRLDLLQKLDQKRIRIIETKAVMADDKRLEQRQTIKEEVVDEYPNDHDEDNENDNTASDDESSDDDMELEIVGAADAKKPLFPTLIPKKPSPLDFLDAVDLMSPRSRKKRGMGRQLSPGRSMTARAMLRNTLMQRQRKMGNMWLARELGYKNEEEHLRDCIEMEEKKRDVVLKKEAERLAANERSQLRERLKDAEEVGLEGGDDEDDQDYELEVGEKGEGDNEEDEEMQLAKAMEKDKDGKASSEPNDDYSAEENDEKEEDDKGRSETNNSGSVARKASANASEASLGQQEEETTSGSDSPTSSSTKMLPSAESEQVDESQQPGDNDFPLFDDGDDEESPRLETQAPPPPPPPGMLNKMALSKPTEEGSNEASAEESIDSGSDSPTEPEFETQNLIGATDPYLGSGDTTTTDESPSEATMEEAREATEGKPDGDSTSQTQAFETAQKSYAERTVETATKSGTNKNHGSSSEAGADIADSEDDELDGDVEESTDNKESNSKPVNKDRNAAWKAMLLSEAEKLKNQKRRKGANEFLETEADEEEEEEVAGLEDFGFSVHKKKNKDDEDENGDDELDAEDLKHIVDDVSDDEGDEETGEKRRRLMEQKEEKERHKEMMRRMREGYDGRRGGIAGGGVGARGLHRFDQLVAADNREAAKQLGLLNDDELDSDNEENEGKGDTGNDEEEDEAALLDKMLKDRFLHRSSTELEETFSEDEAEGENQDGEKADECENQEEQEQELLAKRFAKRARMQRLIDEYGNEEEFTNSRLIDEDETMMLELKSMKNGLARKRSSISSSRSSSISGASSQSDVPSNGAKRQKNGGGLGCVLATGGSLSLALKSNRRQQAHRTSFLGNSQSSTISSQDVCSQHKSISFNHVVFQATDSQLGSRSQSACLTTGSSAGVTKPAAVRKPRVPAKHSISSSLWSKVVAAKAHKKRS